MRHSHFSSLIVSPTDQCLILAIEIYDAQIFIGSTVTQSLFFFVHCLSAFLSDFIEVSVPFFLGQLLLFLPEFGMILVVLLHPFVTERIAIECFIFRVAVRSLIMEDILDRDIKIMTTDTTVFVKFNAHLYSFLGTATSHQQ